MSRSVSRFIVTGALSLLFLLGAGNALAQNADPNSGGPTKNDYRLRVVEPLDGATITGSTVRVTVANALPQSLSGTSRTSDMPNPTYRIYLGNTLKGQLKRDENVLTIDNVSVGDQKLVVEALNASGEVIGRKEINFRTVASTSSAAIPSVPAAEEKPAAPSSSYSATTATTTTSAPSVVQSAPAPEPIPAREPAELPQTASSAPRTAFAGLGLIAVGLLAARKSKPAKSTPLNPSRG